MSIQQMELNADNNNSVVKLVEAKEHLIEDLKKGINVLTSKLNALSQGTLDDTSWNDYLKKEINQLSLLNSKSAKAISGGISAYNVFQRRLDNANLSLQREPKSTYPCGSTTCKERGQKIKDALIEIASYSPESLGSIGVASAASNGLDWTLKAVGVRDKPTNVAPDANNVAPVANVAVDANNNVAKVAPVTPPVTQKSWWSFGGRRTRRR
jgi:hypothetical protein